MIAEYIREKIDSGELPPGSPIKTEREFAREFGLTQSKVHRALASLVADGLLESRRGSGYKVALRRIKRTAWRVAFLSPLGDLSAGLGEEGATFLMKAQAANIRLELFSHGDFVDGDTLAEHMEKIIASNECDAVMINPPTEHADYRKAVLAACRRRFPIIWRDFNPTSYAFSGVGPNHSAIGSMAARTLFAKGHRRTLFLGHSRQVGNTAHDAFTLMGGDLGLECERLDYDRNDFVRVLSEKLKNPSFDSVFAFTGYLSNLAYTTMLNSGIRMPEEMGFLATRRSVFDSGFPMRKADSLVLDNDLYADRLVSILKNVMENPDSVETQILTIQPKYSPGETLRK